MVDPTVPLSRAGAAFSWTVAATLLLASWCTFAQGGHTLPIMLGVTALVFAGVAAVLTIRGWATHVASLVRATARQQHPEGIAPLR